MEAGVPGLLGIQVTPMKKRILIVFLSLTALLVATQPTLAFFGKWKFNKWSLHIVCRQYNAFSPVCAGSMRCMGCCPFPCGGMGHHGCGHQPHCGPAPCCDMGHCPPSCCSTGGCCNVGCLPSPSGPAAKASANDQEGNEGFTPPPPTPLPTMSYYYPQTQTQPVGHYPGYYPQYYNPYYRMPQTYPVPQPYGVPQNYQTPQSYRAPGYNPWVRPVSYSAPSYWYGR